MMIQVSPHSYQPVIKSMFYDDVVNGGRLYTLRCFTSVMMIKYPWGKDYMRFEYKKFMKRLTTVRRCHHPRDPTTTDKSTTHGTFYFDSFLTFLSCVLLTLLQEMLGADNQLQMLISAHLTSMSQTLAVWCDNVKCLCCQNHLQ